MGGVSAAIASAAAGSVDAWEPPATGSFRFESPGRPEIPVFFARGARDAGDLRLLVVMHGTNRNADDYRDAWADLIADQPVLVLVPEFSAEHFPGLVYNLGGMADDDLHIRPRSDWLFGYVEALTAQVDGRLGRLAGAYELFGHSAGAQFVHRFALFGTATRLSRAVAANAGWYTMPTEAADFPYGLSGAPAGVDPGAFGLDLTVLLGEEDTDTENLRQDKAAMAQGSTRVTRGTTFFNTARAAALRANREFRWSYRLVPGVAHDYAAMSAVAATLLE